MITAFQLWQALVNLNERLLDQILSLFPVSNIPHYEILSGRLPVPCQSIEGGDISIEKTTDQLNIRHKDPLCEYLAPINSFTAKDEGLSQKVLIEIRLFND